MTRGTEVEHKAAAMVLRQVQSDLIDLDAVIDDAHLDINWDPIYKRVEALSTGEQVLVGLAQTLWLGRGEARVADLLNWLDAESFAVALEALALRKGQAGRVPLPSERVAQ